MAIISPQSWRDRECGRVESSRVGGRRVRFRDRAELDIGQEGRRATLSKQVVLEKFSSGRVLAILSVKTFRQKPE